ncbi:MAG: hypothetical protein AAF213_01290 [Pseudomonadota bacterium]
MTHRNRAIAAREKNGLRPWLGIGALVLISGCVNSIDIPDVPMNAPLLSESQRDQRALPIQADLGDVVFSVVATEPVAEYRMALLCDSPYNKLYRTDLQRTGIYGRWKQAAPAVLSAAGFVAQGEQVALPRGDQLVIDAWVTDLRISLCRENNFWTGLKNGESGQAYVRVRWQATDKTGRVVLADHTEGAAELEGAARYGRVVLATAAFDSALDAFAQALMDQQRAALAPDGKGPQAAPRPPVTTTDLTRLDPNQPFEDQTLDDQAPKNAGLGNLSQSNPARHDQSQGQVSLTAHRVASTAGGVVERTTSHDAVMASLLAHQSPGLTGSINRHAGRLLAAMVQIDTDRGPILGVVVEKTGSEAMAFIPHTGLRNGPESPSIGSILTTVGDRYQGRWHRGAKRAGMPVFKAVTLNSSPLNDDFLALGQLPLATAQPAIGDAIYAITLPYAQGEPMEPAISRGIISDRCAERRLANGQTLPSVSFQADFPIAQTTMLNRHPDQGGGIILDSSGNLLGFAVPDDDPEIKPQGSRLGVTLGQADGLVCFTPLRVLSASTQ